MAKLARGGEQVVGIGAEAVLVRSNWFGRPSLVKRRLPKGYRLPALDDVLRRQRTILEARALVDAKACGVSTPPVFEVDADGGSITMAYIEGTTLKQLLPSMSPEEVSLTFGQVGRAIGQLHRGGIIHGDLTTSNILVTPKKTLVFIDFGLSVRSESLEDRGVDVHLLKRVLTSTHAAVWHPAYSACLAGYGETGPHSIKEIDTRVRAIELRGRYVRKENRRKSFY